MIEFLKIFFRKFLEKKRVKIAYIIVIQGMYEGVSTSE